VCGPSGAGKSTLIAKLRKEFPDDFGFSVSHTTRSPRKGEQNGVDYNFVDKSLMEEEIAKGKFLESANVHGNYYGTSFEAVDKVSSLYKICILDIDIQGVKSCKNANFDADSYIFISPPNLEILEQRLRGRATDSEESIKKRLAGAKHEMEESKKLKWDAVIVNDDLEKAYRELKAATERARSNCAIARK
jgi:guanylate kinase